MPLDRQIRADVIAILGSVLGNLSPDDRVTYLKARLDGLGLLTHNDCRGDKVTVASHVADRLYEYGLTPDHKPALEVLLRSLLDGKEIGSQWKDNVEGYLERPRSLYEGSGGAATTRTPEPAPDRTQTASPAPTPPQPRTAAKRNVTTAKSKPPAPAVPEAPPADAAATQSITIADNATKAEAAMPESAQQVEEVILLIPGIRTNASWQQKVQRALASPRFSIEPIAYDDFVDLIRFWLPNTRSEFIDRVERDILDAANECGKKGLRLSIIAHSFGTYAVGEVLKKHAYLQLHRLVLCGSVLKKSFEWPRIRKQVFTRVVNDCGSRDWYPILAKGLSWKYGSAGNFGFGTRGVEDRFHNIGHSDFFENDFPTTFWKPWFHEDKLEHSDWHWNRTATGYLMYLADVINLKWMLGLVLACGLWTWWQFGWAGLLVGLKWIGVIVAVALLIYAGVKFLPKTAVVGALIGLLLLVVWRVFPIDEAQPQPLAAIVVTTMETKSEFDADGDLLVTMTFPDSQPGQLSREYAIVGKKGGSSWESELVTGRPVSSPSARTTIKREDFLPTDPGTLACRMTWSSVHGRGGSVVAVIDDKLGELPPNFDKYTQPEFLDWYGLIGDARLEKLLKEPKASAVISKLAAPVDIAKLAINSRKVQILFDGMKVEDLRTMIRLNMELREAFRDYDYTLLEANVNKFITDYGKSADYTTKGALEALQRKMILTPPSDAKPSP